MRRERSRIAGERQEANGRLVPPAIVTTNIIRFDSFPAYRARLDRVWHPALLLNALLAATASDGVVVTEFMASNRTTIVDRDGDASDWIELANLGATSVRLHGWSLSDDARNPGRWFFPDRILEPGTYLVVFASGKDRHGEELHTNFKLSRSGEDVMLVRRDGTVASSIVDYPSLPRDRAFGFIPTEPRFARFLEHATPGAPNAENGWTHIDGPPVVSIEPGSSFDSDLPLVLVTTRAADVTRASSRMGFRVIDRTASGKASFEATPTIVAYGAIRRRGSTSNERPKASYAFEIQDAKGRDLPAGLLGMPADSDWILYGPYEFDRALMRNAFVHELWRRTGHVAVRFRFCELFLTHRGAAIASDDYRGVYLLMEKIKRAPHRVDVEEDGGLLLKIDRPDPGDHGLDAAGQTILFVAPKESESTAAQRADAAEFFEAFGAALHGPEFGDPNRGYARFVDVPSWIDHHLLNELTKNPDGTWQSLYFHKRKVGKVVMGPIWDYDRAMAPNDDDRAADPKGWSGGRDIGWWGRLRQDPEYRAASNRRWRALRRSEWSDASMHAIIDRMSDEIDEAQARNFARWPEVDPGPRGWSVGQVDRLKEWLSTRAAWLDGAFAD